MRIKVGTRGSKLALAQAKEAKLKLERLGFDVELIIIRTKGDIHRETPVENLGKGIFVKEIERELLEGNIDIAVHSSKDMLSELPEGLKVAAYLRRENPSDCLVTRDGRKLHELEEGARIGTSSLRRAFQLLDLRMDLEILPIRGNLDTRLRKLRDGVCDALVVAYSGLLRLGMESLAVEIFDPRNFLPSPGQGALALETRAGDKITSLLKSIDHLPTRVEVEAEKAFLKALGGGCRKAIGAYGRFTKDGIHLKGVLYLDGRRFEAEGEGEDPEELGRWVAEKILRKTGGRSIS
ncbi:hydroxymethylbilane synthase [Candidatus Poribacteria bacterium]|nr:hydroxymethylbilane synthase [Candidatus Poribacteria bacterium]